MTSKEIIRKVIRTYPDYLQGGYKTLIIYAYMVQGAKFPLSVDDVLRCKQPESIRRTFQEMRNDGEVVIPEHLHEKWMEKARKIRKYFHDKKLNIVQPTVITPIYGIDAMGNRERLI